jgi:hypothetical protein
MPSRADIDPTEIPFLLPYISLVDRLDGQFRYRLSGTAIAQQFGQEMTGKPVGFYVMPPEHAVAQRRLYERIFATGEALFVSAEYKTQLGTVHDVSRVMLPLAADGINVNMTIFSRIARFASHTTASRNWLKGANGRLNKVVAFRHFDELQRLCIAWNRCPASLGSPS